MRQRIHRFGAAALALLASFAPALAVASPLYTASINGSGLGTAIGDSNAVGAAANGGWSDPFSGWTGSAYSAAATGSGARVHVWGDTNTINFYCGQNVCVSGYANATSLDMVQIVPTALVPVGTPVSVRLTFSVDGTITGNGGWSVTATGTLDAPPFYVGSPIYAGGTSGTVGAFQQTVHQTLVRDYTLSAGQNYNLATNITVQTFIRGVGPSPYNIDADFLNTLAVHGVVLSAGTGPLQLLGESGHDYLTPVPLPPMAWPLASTLAGLLALRRRRRN